jgi:hypothetical protein
MAETAAGTTLFLTQSDIGSTQLHTSTNNRIYALLTAAGPLLLQVYCCPTPNSPRFLRLCPAAARAGDTKAPTEMRAEEVPPGAPTVDSAGPALPDIGCWLLFFELAGLMLL